MTIEERVNEILSSHGYQKQSKQFSDWRDYEAAKRLCLMEIDPEGSEYDAVIAAVTEYLNV